MEYKFSYKNNKLNDVITLRESRDKKVKEYKKDLSEILLIDPQYIVLLYDSENLEDTKGLVDYNVTDKNYIVIKIEVVVHDMKENKDNLFILEYDETVRELKTKYCDKFKIADVQLTCKGECCEDKDVIEYLKERDCFFSVSLPISVAVIDEFGKSTDIITYWNDTIANILIKLKKQENINELWTMLMIGDQILMKYEKLYFYRNDEPFIIFVGFFISVNNGEQHMISRLVNFNTKIFQLKKDLSVKFGIEINMITLMNESRYLMDEETVGFYQLKNGDQINFFVNTEIIIVSVSDDNVMEFIVKKFQTIKDIKEELSVKCGISSGRIILRSDNKELSNESTFDSLELNEATILQMVFKSDEGNYLPLTLELDDEDLQNKAIDGKLMFDDVILQDKDLRSSSFSDNEDYTNDNKDLKEENLENNEMENPIPTVSDEEIKVEITVDDKEASSVGIIEEKVNNLLDDEELKNESSDVWMLCDQETMEEVMININSNEIPAGEVDKERSDDRLARNVIDRDETVNESLEIEFSEYLDPRGKCLGDRVSEVGEVRSESMLTSGEEECDNIEVQVTVIDGFVRDGARRDISLCVDDSLDVLRRRLEDLFSPAPSKYVLSVKGQILSDESLMQINNADEILVSDMVRVNCMIEGEQQMKMFSFMSGDKVQDLKGQIMKEMNIDMNSFNVYFNGCPLDKDSTLEEYGMESGVMLSMVIEGEES